MLIAGSAFYLSISSSNLTVSYLRTPPASTSATPDTQPSSTASYANPHPLYRNCSPQAYPKTTQCQPPTTTLCLHSWAICTISPAPDASSHKPPLYEFIDTYSNNTSKYESLTLPSPRESQILSKCMPY